MTSSSPQEPNEIRIYDDVATTPLLLASFVSLLRELKSLHPALSSSDTFDTCYSKCQAFLSTDLECSQEDEDALGVWTDRMNREQVFHTLLKAAAIRYSAQEARYQALNVLANQRTLISRLGPYLATWRLHVRFARDLRNFLQPYEPTIGLFIRPEFGLSMFEALDCLPSLRFVCYTDAPLSYTAEASLMEANLALCRPASAFPDKVSLIQCLDNQQPDYLVDFIVLEDVRNLKRRASALATVNELVKAWRQLRVGGFALLEGIAFRANLINHELWQAGPEGGIRSFMKAYEDVTNQTEYNGIIILEKLA